MVVCCRSHREHLPRQTGCRAPTERSAGESDPCPRGSSASRASFRRDLAQRRWRRRESVEDESQFFTGIISPNRPLDVAVQTRQAPPGRHWRRRGTSLAVSISTSACLEAVCASEYENSLVPDGEAVGRVGDAAIARVRAEQDIAIGSRGHERTVFDVVRVDERLPHEFVIDLCELGTGEIVVDCLDETGLSARYRHEARSGCSDPARLASSQSSDRRQR